MWRWTLVLAVAACGSRSNDAPPKPAPPRDAGVAAAPGVAAPKTPPFEIAPPTDKLVAVGRDEHHTCVVRASGAVDCWGVLAPCKTCELGAPPDPSVRRIPGITDAVNVSANGTCFIRKTGEAACFGETGLPLVPVPGITGAIASDAHGWCYVDAKGGVTCRDTGKTWKVPGLTDAVSLVENELGVCAIRKTGTLACGTAFDGAAWKPVRGIDRVSALAMAGRMDSYVCVMRAGALRCFEMSPYGDDGGVIVVDPDSKEHPLAAHVAKKFAGATRLVMRTEDNQFFLEGVIGGRVVATDFADVWDVPQLEDAAVLARQCAIRTQGSLVCWGSNAGGSLAQPTTIMKADVPPTTVVGLSDVVDIGVGLSRSYALTGDGKVWWWGRLWSRFSLTSTAAPVELKLGLGPKQLVQIIATEANQACMRSSGGEVWCQVDYFETRIEQLDTDAVRDIEEFGGDVIAYRTDAPPEVHRIAGGSDPIIGSIEITERDDPSAAQPIFNYDTPCARYQDGTVKCPTKIEGITSATRLVLGAVFGCVIQRGRVWCWLDAETYKRGPLSEIAGLRDVTDLAASPNNACAVHDGGRVSCWTYDQQHVESDRYVRRWNAPVEIIHGGAVDVELGQGYSGQYARSFNLHGPDAAGVYGCARMADRTVQCWGMNVFGELGDGSLVRTAAPIGVTL